MRCCCSASGRCGFGWCGCCQRPRSSAPPAASPGAWLPLLTAVAVAGAAAGAGGAVAVVGALPAVGAASAGAAAGGALVHPRRLLLHLAHRHHCRRLLLLLVLRPVLVVLLLKWYTCTVYQWYTLSTHCTSYTCMYHTMVRTMVRTRVPWHCMVPIWYHWYRRYT